LVGGTEGKKVVFLDVEALEGFRIGERFERRLEFGGRGG
jgi:hypothetical protein